MQENKEVNATECRKTNGAKQSLKFTGSYTEVNPGNRQIRRLTLLHEKLLQFDWLRAVVFELNLKYLHVKITNLLQVVV